MSLSESCQSSSFTDDDGILPTPKNPVRPQPILTDPYVNSKPRRSASSVSTIATPSSIASISTPLSFSRSLSVPFEAGPPYPPPGALLRSSTWSVADSAVCVSPKYSSRSAPPTINIDSYFKGVALSKPLSPAIGDNTVDAMESFVNPDAPPPPTYLVKTKACRHFARGYCAFGDKCAFAHSADELRVRPGNLCKTKLCDRGRNCRRVNCGYAHSREELFRVDETQNVTDDMIQYYQDLQYIEQLGVIYAASSTGVAEKKA
ncbi:hypothetical protein FOL47_005183 [Perkinsus chesapeaki]|uniref:C3H1-type domain-containing protein n=1 Tax=Perkinsus chesapeaki TaxID=330153 RepID=A0A7J6MYQ1_PERCH|nr:hypothetical protein FOL47_005183 [Perkinsus chesapeaki]